MQSSVENPARPAPTETGRSRSTSEPQRSRVDLLIPENETDPEVDFRMQPFSPWRDRLVMQTLALMLRHRILCVLLVLAAGAAGGLATKLKQPFYIAHATIFPSVASNPLGNLGLGSVAGLVGSFGLGDPTSQFPLYENFLVSRTLLLDLLGTSLKEAGRQGTLLDHLDVQEPDPVLREQLALDAVRAGLSYESDKKTGLVSIGYRDFDARVAAVVVNRAVDLLDHFDVSTSSGRAGDRRKFIEGRLSEAARNLGDAETRLETFRQENLRIGNAPSLILEQVRLERELQIEQEIYLTLRKEVELARIEEQRSVPVVNILDRASPPPLPAGPSVVRNAAMGGFLGVVVLVGFFAMQALGSLRVLRNLGAPRARRS